MAGKDHLVGLIRPSIEELEATYPGLRRIVQHAGAVVGGKFAGLRDDLSLIKPPVVIVERENLRPIHDSAFFSGPSEMRGRVHPASFEMFDGIIYLVSEETKRNLERGKQGRDYLTIMVAEEYVHAYTTVQKNGSVRMGFQSIGQSKRDHGLIVGEIYTGELRHEVESGYFSVYVPRRMFRLTDRLTNIAVHLMLPELLPDIGSNYPLMAIIPGDKKKDVIRKTKEMLDIQEILRSLLDADRRKLRQFFTDRELETMSAQDSHVFSLNLRTHHRQGVLQGELQVTPDVLTFSN